MVTKDSVAQFPEGRAGTADTVLNFCLDGGFLGQVTVRSVQQLYGKCSTTSRIPADTLISGGHSLMLGGG